MHRKGLSLLELMAVLSVIGIFAMLVLPRVAENSESADTAACLANKGDIEIQAELWLQDDGSWPAADLSDIGANATYFPEGVPTCPVDGSSYTIDASTGRVIGHDH